MNHNLLQLKLLEFSYLLLFYFLIFFLLLPEPVLSVDKLFGTCVPERCDDGKGPDIRFPFWIPGKHPPHCGYPGFQLTCDNQQPILKLFASEYIIKNINYEDQFFSVVDKRLMDDTHCPLPPFTLAFSHSVFHIVESNHSLLFFYNCTEEKVLPQYQSIPCIPNNETHHSFARLNFTGSLMSSWNLPKKCEPYVSVPVMMDSKPQDNYLEMLHKGFLLNWTAPNCSRCLESGGQCGYSENEYKCFCRDRPQPTSCADKSQRKGADKSKRKKLILGTTAGVGIFLLTCFLVFIICLVRKLPSDKANDTQNVEAFLENYGSLIPKRYQYSELKKMTNSFKDNLGQGGYGSVFKGKLNDGRLIAVKVLNNLKGSKGVDFINEVSSVGRTNHVNIVTLLGFCSEGSKRALVYEFMLKGSLEKFIFSNKPGTENALDCQKLFQIAVGIARGLEYLHRGCNTRIVHFDIKPHNILLDDDFCPKISDFGLAKLCPQQQSTLSMLDARGTIGYTAPEVFCRNIGGISHKSDVYSYGMMMLEMIGGRKNIDAKAENTSEIYFPHWVYKHIELKQSLGLLGFRTEAEEDIGRKMVFVGLWCIQTDPTNRPSMSRVLEMLEGSLGSLEMPPKPYLSSPPRSCSSTT